MFPRGCSNWCARIGEVFLTGCLRGQRSEQGPVIQGGRLTLTHKRESVRSLRSLEQAQGLQTVEVSLCWQGVARSDSDRCSDRQKNSLEGLAKLVSLCRLWARSCEVEQPFAGHGSHSSDGDCCQKRRTFGPRCLQVLVQTAVAECIDTDKVFWKIAAIQKVFVLMQ